MTVPVDPFDFANGTIADADQVDLRFKKLYDTLNPAVQGIAPDNVQPGTFLRLLTTGTDRRLKFAYQALALPGGSADTNSVTVNHGLGATPVAIFATAGLAPGGHVIAVSFSAFGSSTFTLRGTVVDGTAPGAATVDCFWAAIA